MPSQTHGANIRLWNEFTLINIGTLIHGANIRLCSGYLLKNMWRTFVLGMNALSKTGCEYSSLDEYPLEKHGVKIYPVKNTTYSTNGFREYS